MQSQEGVGGIKGDGYYRGVYYRFGFFYVVWLLKDVCILEVSILSGVYIRGAPMAPMAPDAAERSGASIYNNGDYVTGWPTHWLIHLLAE